MIFLSLHELLIFNLSISIFTWTLLAIILNWNTLIILLFFCWWWHDVTHFNHNITLLTTGRSFLNSLVSWFAFWFLFFCVGDQSLRRRRLKITNNFFFHLFTIPQYKSTISLVFKLLNLLHFKSCRYKFNHFRESITNPLSRRVSYPLSFRTEILNFCRCTLPMRSPSFNCKRTRKSALVGASEWRRRRTHGRERSVDEWA